MQLDPTDVKTVSAATTDSVMKKDFTVSLDCTAQGSKDKITGASYATVTGYLAAAKEQRLMPALLRWITPTFLLRVRKGLVSRCKTKTAAMQSRRLPPRIARRK